MIYVKPKDGLVVRHPEKRDFIIPKEGTWVNESTYMTRLINDGDVSVDEKKTHAAKTKAASAEGDKE